MSTIARLITEDELLRMPDGSRYELIEGKLRPMSPTGYEHGKATGNFCGLLGLHVRMNKLGDVLAAGTGFVIARTPDGRATVLAPDVAFIAKGRVPVDGDTRRYLELAPDLIAETLSPSDTAREVDEKVVMWLRAGVRVVLTLDPASKSAKVHRSQNDTLSLGNADEPDLVDVVPALRCRVLDIFD
jgi:Uma2 family endonuclease